MLIQGIARLPQGLTYCQVEVMGASIGRIVTEEADFKEPTHILRANEILCPGFIDPQINGGFGKEFKTDSDAVASVAKQIVRFGVTSIAPTVTTMPVGKYRAHLETLMDAYGEAKDSARIVGFHIEGPFLNPKKRGAHPEALLVEQATWDVLEDVLSEHVAIFTLAPEVPGGWDLAAAAESRGIRVGLGHSMAEYEDVIAHFSTEAMHVVHTYNAMPELSGRAPGLVGVALDRQDFFASVIADLVHVHPASLRILWTSRNRGSKLFAVSDGSAVLGLEPGIHTVGAREIERRVDRAVLAGTETLVGSVLTMNVAARNLRTVTGCTFEEAIDFVTVNAATYLGWSDRIGSIASGLFADLCVIDREFNVQLTIVGGSIVHVVEAQTDEFDHLG